MRGTFISKAIKGFSIALMLTACLGLASCGSSSKTGGRGSKEAGNQITAESKNMTYNAEDVDNADLKSIKDPSWVGEGNGIIIFRRFQTIDKKTGKAVDENDIDYEHFDKKYINQNFFYEYDVREDKLTELKNLESNYANKDLSDIFLGSDGNALLNFYDSDDSGSISYNLKLVDKDFKEIKSLDELSKRITEITNDPNGDGGYMKLFLADGDKPVVVTYKTIEIYDENGKKVKKEKVPVDKATDKEMPVDQVCMLSDHNRILIRESDYGSVGESADALSSSEENNAKTIYYIYDIAKGTWSEPFITDGVSYSGSLAQSIIPSLNKDFDFYSVSEKKMFGMKFGSDEKKGVIDFTASGVNDNDIMNITDAGDGSFIIDLMDNTNSGSSNKFMKLTKVDPKDIKDKQELTVSTLYEDDNLTKLVIDFNKKSDKYKVNIVSYGDNNDPVGKFNEDIAAGHIPDIISMGELNANKYAEKGLLEDLTPYFDKDPDVNISDFQPNFVDACKIDGKLYYMSSSFNISTLAMPKNEANSIDKLDMAAVLDLYKSKPEGTCILQGMPLARGDLLMTFLDYQLNDYIDWNTGKCSFDSNGFKDLLKLCHDAAPKEVSDDAYDNMTSLKEQIKDHKIIFATSMGMFDPATIYMNDKLYKSCGGVEYTGYPTEDGGKNYFQLGSSAFAIYSKSEAKDGAWEFIKNMYTKDYQESLIGQYEYAIPTRLDVYDDYEKLFTATKKYKASNGQEIEPYANTYSIDDKTTVNIKPVSEEQAARFKSIIENTKSMQASDTDVTKIISDEAAAYFNDDKSVDDVIDIIQNRVSNYVNENR
ncbi:MAG: extracellular solute-binding protein [Lachnospiraceae bacterium]|nr:extracellular solute-binding protein [Lachnospiraceae bacterium]